MEYWREFLWGPSRFWHYRLRSRRLWRRASCCCRSSWRPRPCYGCRSGSGWTYPARGRPDSLLLSQKSLRRQCFLKLSFSTCPAKSLLSQCFESMTIQKNCHHKAEFKNKSIKWTFSLHKNSYFLTYFQQKIGREIEMSTYELRW